MKQKIDAAIYTPLEEEFNSLRSKFIPESNINGITYTGYLGRSLNNELVAVITGFGWGNDLAYGVMVEILKSYDPKLAVCIGIGGGLTNDAKLGDVFYSSQVFDLTQRMKFAKDKKGVNRTTYDPEPYASSNLITRALDRLRLQSIGSSPYSKWVEDCELRNGSFLAGHDTRPLGHATTHFAKPCAKPGKIASTNAVLADENAVEDVKACGRKMACVDTEGAGFAKACHERQLSAHIVIRGVSDMADENKKIVEQTFKNVFRNIAASNATLFLYNHLTVMLKGVTFAEIDTRELGAVSANPERLAIEANEISLRDELTRRSVVFKTIDQEYRMPVPRIRNFEAVLEGKGKKKLLPAQEIEDIVEHNDKIIIQLSKHYPDTALPWLFGHLLTEPNSRSGYPIPVCIRWQDYGPPRNSLDAHLDEKGLLFTKNNPLYQVIFIFTDVLVGIKNKPQFLSNDFKEFNNAKVILFQDRNEAGVLKDEMSKTFQPESFVVDGISFSSITNYVKSSLGMTLEESEVLATRLISTFHAFRLKVHPTYLASIQKDTVNSFIDANQRGELIELAVAGLLSVLVTDDRSRVVLRRGTRERFLTQLAVSIYDQKQRFDDKKLEEYVANYATEMGFDIEPHQFVKLFLDNGILSYEGGFIEISIPVIRSYMLAKGLAAQGVKAVSYFDLTGTMLDTATFDLFCEFNDDASVYQWMSAELDESISYFSDKINSYKNPVLDGQFQTRLLSKDYSFSRILEDISKKAASLVSVTSLVSEKQAKLDVQFEISQSEAAKNLDLSDADKFRNEYAGTMRYFAAAVMLGSAAEKMNDTAKLSIITKLVKLGGLICTDLLTIFSEFDIDETVAQVMQQFEDNDEIKFETPKSREEFEKFVELNVSLMQFDFAAHVTTSLISQLCEFGRTSVLLSPIERASTSSKLEEFLQMTWAFDLDPVGKRRLPKDFSKKLGASPFLRTIFGISMVTRSYWFHHGRQRREAVADGIDEMFKPLSLRSDIDLSDVPLD